MHVLVCFGGVGRVWWPLLLHTRADATNDKAMDVDPAPENGAEKRDPPDTTLDAICQYIFGNRLPLAFSTTYLPMTERVFCQISNLAFRGKAERLSRNPSSV